MLLFETKIEGANYQIKPLKYQEALTSTGYDLADIKVTGPIAECAKSPLGTLFIAVSHKVEDEDHIVISDGKLIPVAYGKTVFPIPSSLEKEVVQSMCDTLIDYMLDINPSEYEKEDVESIAKQLEAFGYAYDWSEKTAEKPFDLETASGSS